MTRGRLLRSRLARRRLLREATITYVAAVLTLAINLLTGLILARALGTTGRGELTAILTVPQMVGWAFSLGCGLAIAYHQARHPADGGRLLGTWIGPVLVLGCLAFISGEALLAHLLAAQTPATYRLAQLYMLIVLISPFADLIQGFLLGDHDFSFYNAARVAQPAVAAFLYLSLWRLDQLTVEAAVAVLAAVAVVGTLVAAGRVLRRHSLSRPSRSLGQTTAWYGLRVHGSNVGGVLNTRLDLLIIPAFVAASEVGLYSVATSVSWMVFALSGPLTALVLPMAARQDQHGSRTVVHALQMTLLIAVVLAGGIAVLAEVGVRLVYGSAFADAALPLRLLLPGTVLYAGACVLGAGLQAAGHPFASTAAQAAGVPVSVIGLLLFLDTAGINAAAVASSASYSVIFITALMLYRRKTGVSWHELLPVRGPACLR